MISPSPITFLGCPTPTKWIQSALENLPILLIDHAHCEKKAAASAISFIHRYPQYPALLHKLSRLAREELRHFEHVLAILKKREITYRHLSPSRYAASMHEKIRRNEPERLIDSLIIGAFVEARSCERFASLIPHLDSELGDFYQTLHKAEARHFENYLELASEIDPADVRDRTKFFSDLEASLILSEDPIFRFHSGVPSIEIN